MRRRNCAVTTCSVRNDRNPVIAKGGYLFLVLVAVLFAQKSWSAQLRLSTPAEVAARHHNERGISFIGKGAPDRAIAEFNKALELHPDFLWPLFNRGLVYRRMGKYENAITDFDKVIESGNPNAKVAGKGTYLSKEQFADVYFQRGTARLNKADYDLAITDFGKSLEINPNVAAAFNNRGAAFLEKWQFEQATSDLERAIKLNPKYALAYMNRGILHYRQGQNNLAVRDYDEALRLDPKLAIAYANRGRTHSANRRFDEAHTDFNKALKINPNTATAHHGLAMLLTAEGRYTEAEPRFIQALALYEQCSGTDHPHTLEVLEHFVMMLRKASRESEAKEIEGRLNTRTIPGKSSLP